MGRLEGRTALVTGASRGIGRAIAIQLSRLGAKLVLMGRDQARLEETAKMLATGEAELVSLDLKNPASIAGV